MSPSVAVPTTRLATTRGMTTMVMRRIQAVPAGSMAVRAVTSHSTSKMFATNPTRAPRIRAIAIFV
jgi:hypothetical protein